MLQFAISLPLVKLNCLEKVQEKLLSADEGHLRKEIQIMISELLYESY